MTDTPSITTAPALDADYEAAMASIRQAIDHFRGCTPEERASLQRDLDQLHSMADKLAAGTNDTGDDEAGLLAVLGPHNHKEENILYPMIDQVTAGAERTQIFAEMEKRP